MASQERCCCTNAVARANARPAGALDLLASGRAALSEGRWERARELFERARALEESGEAVEGLAIVALWRSEVEVASKTSERAFHLYRERGDGRGAARMAIWLAFQAANFKGEGAVASGWLRRARSLLQEIETGPEHGWLWVREASVVLGSDAERARELSSAACELGRALGVSPKHVVPSGPPWRLGVSPPPAPRRDPLFERGPGRAKHEALVLLAIPGPLFDRP